MLQTRLTHQQLQREITKELVRYTLFHGQGGPLLFLWTVGIAVFLFMVTLPLYAVPWTGAVLVLGLLAMRDYRKDRKVQHLLVQSVTEKRFPTRDLSDPKLQDDFEKGIELFAEIALKIHEIERTRGADVRLRQMLGDTDAMISMQYESAKQAQELERGLRLIGSGRAGIKRPGLTGAKTSDAERLHDENLSAIKRAATEARAMVADVSRKLEVLMLQLFQLEHSASDLVRTEEMARETEDTLGRIQEEVDARRKAADTVIETLFPKHPQNDTP